MIEVIRSGPRRPAIFVANGKPCLARELAAAMGITRDGLNKRVRRGTPLAQPVQPHYRDDE